MTVGVLFIAAACSASIESGDNAAPDATQGGASGPAVTTEPATSTTSSTVPSTTSRPTTTTSTSTTTTSTTTTMPEPDVFDAACVVEVEPFDSLGLIANQFDDETVNVVSLRAENSLPTAAIEAGQLLDVCVGNGIDDLTGEQRSDPDEAIVGAAVRQNVEVQQLKLNRLFDGLGTPPLLVDGVSGSVTRQRLCAFRLSLGLPVSTSVMAAGSDEEKLLLAATELAVPPSSATSSTRWVLVDQTCQILFAGSGSSDLSLVFPTSTGSEGFETRPQDRSNAFRYDPAVDNNGWHNSTDFPVPIDNPLNGNMYRPLYFDGGQAIHGANNVPTSPQSKGCARLRVTHMDALVDWLGLGDARAPIWNQDRIAVTVNVQGEYQG